MRTKLILLGLITLSTVSAWQGCKPYSTEKELRKVDTLINKVKEADNTLIIDINAIKNRYDSIKMISEYVEKNYDREPGKKFTTMMNRYLAIKGKYKRVIDSYEVVEYENKEHRKRLKNLKKDLVENNISGKQFDTIYRNERRVVNEHLMKSRRLVRSLTQVEKEFRRTHEYVSKVYERLKGRETKKTENS